MKTIILEVSSEKDIVESRWTIYDLALAEARLCFVDAESRETVDVLYWNEETGFSHFLN